MEYPGIRLPKQTERSRSPYPPFSLPLIPLPPPPFFRAPTGTQMISVEPLVLAPELGGDSIAVPVLVNTEVLVAWGHNAPPELPCTPTMQFACQKHLHL